MADTETRLRLLEAGALMVQKRSFGMISLQEIAHTAGIPEDVCVSEFQDLETFGKSLVNMFLSVQLFNLRKHLNNERYSPLVNLRRYFDDCIENHKLSTYSLGCPLGRLALEPGLSDDMRSSVRLAMREITEAFEHFLMMAKEIGELYDSFNTASRANLILSAWHGTQIQSQLQKSAVPLEEFRDYMLPEALK